MDAGHRTSFDQDHVLTDLRGDLRVKAFVIVRRNQTRDYLLCRRADRMGVPAAAAVLANIDELYADQYGRGRRGVAGREAVGRNLVRVCRALAVPIVGVGAA